MLRALPLLLFLAASCAEPERLVFVEDCTNNRDDDLDDIVDCLDPDCNGQCPEICGDAQDNDGDGDADCADRDCDGGCAEACDDGRDNDGDGSTDCADADCFGPCPEDCADGRDNDADGWVDCADQEDCFDACPEDCGNDVDDNGEGRIDCADPHCFEVCDADGDGVIGQEWGGDDCDDDDPENFPFNDEVCDGVDNNCDGLVDDGDPRLDLGSATTWYPDADADGFGDYLYPQTLCEPPPDHVTDDTDCEDDDAAVNPGEVDVCNFKDDDCDGLVDAADPDADIPTWYVDEDRDGLGDPSGATIVTCFPPQNAISDGSDCDDSDPEVLGATDWYADLDADGFGAGASVGGPSCIEPVAGSAPDWFGLDCDDADAAVHPDADEVCSGVDDNCDGLVDEDDPGLDTSTMSAWHPDTDLDGFGSAAQQLIACEAPAGWIAAGSDCDDALATVYPGAPEVCEDFVDQDCDGKDIRCP